MIQIAVAEADSNLAHFIEAARRGEEVVIVDAGRIIAKLVLTEEPEMLQPRKPGSAKDKILYIADDFDAPLEDFAEYM